MDILNTLGGVAFTTDGIVILAVFAVFFLFSLWFGKSQSISLLLSLYLGMLAFENFPFLSEMTFLKSSEVQITLSHIVVFLIGVSVIHMILRRVIFTEYPFQIFIKYFQVAVLSLSITLLLLAFLYHSIPFGSLYDFGESVDTLFSSQYFFWLLLSPLFGLLLVSRR